MGVGQDRIGGLARREVTNG